MTSSSGDAFPLRKLLVPPLPPILAYTGLQLLAASGWQLTFAGILIFFGLVVLWEISAAIYLLWILPRAVATLVRNPSMRVTRNFGAISVAALFLIGVAIHFYEYEPEPGAVSQKIAARVVENNAQSIDVSSLTDFPWTELRVYAPYVSRDTICRDLALSLLRCIWVTPRSVAEGDYFLVFLDGNELVHWERHHWPKAHIQGLRHPVSVYRREIRFNVRRERSGDQTFFVLKEAL